MYFSINLGSGAVAYETCKTEGRRQADGRNDSDQTRGPDTERGAVTYNIN